MGGLARFGPAALREIPGPGRKQDKQFPAARGPETEKKVTTLSGMVVPMLSFDRPDPHGREDTKYEDFGPFWPRTAVGT